MASFKLTPKGAADLVVTREYIARREGFAPDLRDLVYIALDEGVEPDTLIGGDYEGLGPIDQDYIQVTINWMLEDDLIEAVRYPAISPLAD